MIVERDYAARQIQGGRPYQEDYYTFAQATLLPNGPPDGIILALADGMGGHMAGDYASQLAVRGFLEGFANHNGLVSSRLNAALKSSNRAIEACTEENPDLTNNIGTTLIGLVTDGKQLEWISVGDSVLILFRQNHTRRLNADHSLTPLLQSRVLAGLMSAQEAATHPERNTLRSAVTGSPIDLVDHPPFINLNPGDIIITASDGILSLSNDFLRQTLITLKEKTAAAMCENLLQEVETLNLPRQDNTTIAVIKIPF